MTISILCYIGISDKLLKNNDDFVWAIDILFSGRFIIDVEFLDIKIVPQSVSNSDSFISKFSTIVYYNGTSDLT